MRRASKKSLSSAATASAGAEQVNEKQNRKRKGVSTNLTSRKAQRGPTKAVSKEVERIDQFFYTYADNSSVMIDPEGIETLCSHLEVPHTDVRILMLAWKMGCEKQGYFTLDEWRAGLKALRADSISKLKKAFPELVQEVILSPQIISYVQVTRPSNFQDFYIYAFRYCLTEDKKKCIEIPVACELLNLVLGLQFRPQVDKLSNYLKYQNDYKVINMDQWMGFMRFCNEINFPSLDNYDSDLAWPLILDNFVEWLRENKS
ncbi:Defective in cullin neddylation protein [Zea mays]|uniref:Defective in cullin neddylation protein n=1 Tax=Zea mays TaxID=4577 RepID=A0A1D6KNV5_MAIZE|nr:Defective in cullin neddylation protein [Zea mays]